MVPSDSLYDTTPRLHDSTMLRGRFDDALRARARRASSHQERRRRSRSSVRASVRSRREAPVTGVAVGSARRIARRRRRRSRSWRRATWSVLRRRVPPLRARARRRRRTPRRLEGRTPRRKARGFERFRKFAPFRAEPKNGSARTTPSASAFDPRYFRSRKRASRTTPTALKRSTREGVCRAARTPRTSRTASLVEAGNARESGKTSNEEEVFFSSAFSSARRSRTSRTPRTPRRRFAD